MRIPHRDSLLIVLSVRPVRAQCSTKGSAESASVDQRTDRKNAPTSQNGMVGGGCGNWFAGSTNSAY
jgi:hypothetical protein